MTPARVVLVRRRRAATIAIVALSTTAALVALHAQQPPAIRPESTPRPPNVVIILADDMGYADASVTGATGYKTPSIDRMAGEGVRFTDYYVAEPVCSASRAALMTGRYSKRVGVSGALSPGDKGLNHDELTIAELLKARGYATAAFGKWHLGDQPGSLPTHHGFDEFGGLPYSNDMWPKNPNAQRPWPALMWIDGDRPVKEVTEAEQALLTKNVTDRAVRFIESHATQPFFLYVAHPMPHVPIYASAAFQGKTAAGLYADVMAELDWSVGEIHAALTKAGVDGNTVVFFASDNGPWLMFGNHGGNASPFRQGKHTTFEGGVRVPLIVRWPGRIPPGKVVGTPAMNIDLLPTIVELAGGAVPADRIMDGRTLTPALMGTGAAAPPREALYFYGGFSGQEFHAVRAGRWKLHVPHPYVNAVPANGGARGKYEPQQLPLSLFDLEADPGEATNVADAHPDVVATLMEHVERARAELGDALTKRDGRGVGLRLPPR